MGGLAFGVGVGTAAASFGRRPVFRSGEFVESLLEPARMGAFGLGQRLEPVCDLFETFFPRVARHARIYVGVFMRFAGDE